jgi:hypothetical protein
MPRDETGAPGRSQVWSTEKADHVGRPNPFCVVSAVHHPDFSDFLNFLFAGLPSVKRHPVCGPYFTLK